MLWSKGKKGMEFIFGSIFLLIVVVAFRITKAQKRLQACIDNGTVIFDGISIEISEDLPEEQALKIKIERKLYLGYRRAIPGSSRLHQKNSQY